MTLKDVICKAIDDAGLGSLSTPAAMAAVFCEWDDEQQAQFFVEVAATMQAWPRPDAHTFQAFYIGGHLKTCACSTDGARDFVRAIADRLEPA